MLQQQQQKIDKHFVLRLLIDTSWSVAVTANMEKLGTKYNAIFNVLDRATPECVLSIQCPLTTIEQCVAEMLRKIDSVKTPKQRSLQDILVLIHRRHAEALVRDKGKKLVELLKKEQQQKRRPGNPHKKETCSFKVASVCCPGSTEHVCRIVATLARLPGTIKLLIDDIFTAIPLNSLEQQKLYDPKNHNPDAAYGGFGCNKQLMNYTIPKVQKQQQQQRALPTQFAHQHQQPAVQAAVQTQVQQPSFQPLPPPPPPPPQSWDHQHYLQQSQFCAAAAVAAATNSFWPAIAPSSPMQMFAQPNHEFFTPAPPPPPPPPPEEAAIPMDICDDEQPSSTTTIAGDHQQQNGTQCNQQRELDLLKQRLEEAEQSRKLAEQSRDRAEERSKNLEKEVDHLSRQLQSMRVAQAEFVNGQNQLDALLAKERANVQKLERKNGELVEETVTLGKQCKQLKLSNTQLLVEMDCLKRNRQNAENSEENKVLLAKDRENMQKLQFERDALVEQSLEREAQMLALNQQLRAMSEQCDELKQAKEDLDWMMANKDELVAVEVEKQLKGQILAMGNGTAITATTSTVIDELRSQIEQLKESLRSAEAARERAELNQQTARLEFEHHYALREKAEEDRLRALKFELKEAHRTKKVEHAQRKALEEEVEKLRRQQQKAATPSFTTKKKVVEKKLLLQKN